MTTPIIVVDDAIPWAAEAFAPFGRLVLASGSAIDRPLVDDADALVVRTVTRVDDALVTGTRLGFVGTATAGTDHIDTAALERGGIRFASAAGCNAHAVVDYVVTALHLLALERDRTLLAGPCAIVGFGQVGRRLATRLRALGMVVRVCDPPLARDVAAGMLDRADPWQRLAIDEPLLSLADATMGARIVSVHVPLVNGGADPTPNLIGRAVLEALAPNAIVFNTSRGSVVDEAALGPWLDHTGGRAVLDVWTGEPEIDPTMVLHPRVRLATPHIAGYTLEGKIAATAMIARALADHFGHEDAWRGDDVLGEPQDIDVPPGPSALARTTECLRRCNPIERDDAMLRALARAPAPRREQFEALRRNYAFRRALAHHRVDATAMPALVDVGLVARPTDALVLVAHGSPDPDWRIPLDAVLARMQSTQPQRAIVLAFLDHLAPSLDAAVASLAQRGHTAARVIAVFLSPGGGHIKRDLPALVERVRAAHPAVELTLEPGAIGAEADVIDSIATAALRVASRTRY